MARIEDVERRLLNWARWRIGGQRGGLGYSSVSWGMTVGSARGREAVIPTNAAEATDTDNAVKALMPELQRVVMGHYVDGYSVAAVSVQLGCSVATVYARIDRTHQLLDQAFRDLAAARRIERERVERMARAKRGGFRE